MPPHEHEKVVHPWDITVQTLVSTTIVFSSFFGSEPPTQTLVELKEKSNQVLLCCFFSISAEMNMPMLTA